MTFIRTLDHGFINKDHIQRATNWAWNKETKRSKVKFVLSNGEEIRAEVGNNDLETLLTIDPVIPAQPGFTLLVFYKDGDVEETYRSAVIAWKVDTEFFEYHKAIALDAPVRDEYLTGVLCPDGRVIDPGNKAFANENEWLEYAREQAAREKTHREKIAAAE